MRSATRLGMMSMLLAALALAATGACDEGGAADPEAVRDGGPTGAAGDDDDDETRADGGSKHDASNAADGAAASDGGGGGEGGAIDPNVAPKQLVALTKYFEGDVVKLADVADAGHVPVQEVDAGGEAPLEAAHAASPWGLLLPNGVVLPWDDGLAKTFDQTLANPDLQDMLLMPYAPGAITPVNTENHDPGRIRSDELFKQTFGASAAAVEARLDDVTFVDESQKFHELASAALTRVSNRLQTLIDDQPAMAKYVSGGPLGGTYEWRPILNTNRLSVHSYGAAIDIIVKYSAYWEWAGDDFTWENEIPQEVVDAFEAEKFVWGGRWYHYDTMHFEYRPELFDPDCKL